MNSHYDIIYISESGFQKKIIEHLISNIYPNKKYLWLDGKEGCFIDNYNNVYKIDLNHIRGIFKSIGAIASFPKLSCDFLIGTHFTGVNCRFFEAVIKYKELHLIDDGIGTPLILRTPTFYRSQPTSLLKFYVVRLLSFLLRFKYIKTTRSIIQTVKKYYSIYRNDSLNIPLVGINPFTTDNLMLYGGSIGYIGQPLVEYGIIEEKYYKEHLLSIIEKFKKPILYYADPSEKLIYSYKIDLLTIADKDEPLESFITKNGIPEIITSFVSSALLNLKLMCPEIRAFYNKIPNQDKKRKLYYDIFEENDIKLLDL